MLQSRILSLVPTNTFRRKCAERVQVKPQNGSDSGGNANALSDLVNGMGVGGVLLFCRARVCRSNGLFVPSLVWFCLFFVLRVV